MNSSKSDPLLLAGKVLIVIIQVALVLVSIALALAIPALVIWHGEIIATISSELGTTSADFPLAAIIVVLALVLGAIVMILLFFQNLRKIIDTVGTGDPFAPENARRLNVMAWLMLAAQVIGLPIAAIGMMASEWAEEIEGANINFETGIDITGILMVVVLFILARVFKRGAEMREDLEGTV